MALQKVRTSTLIFTSYTYVASYSSLNESMLELAVYCNKIWGQKSSTYIQLVAS